MPIEDQFKSDADAMTRALFGDNAIKVPFNAIVQDQGQVCLVIAQIASPKIKFGGTKTHQLILGDAVVRPHLVVEIDGMRGRGAAGLIRTPPQEWIEQEDLSVLVDIAGRVLTED